VHSETRDSCLSSCSEGIAPFVPPPAAISTEKVKISVIQKAKIHSVTIPARRRNERGPNHHAGNKEAGMAIESKAV
jgi:hypothetical protein